MQIHGTNFHPRAVGQAVVRSVLVLVGIALTRGADAPGAVPVGPQPFSAKFALVHGKGAEMSEDRVYKRSSESRAKSRAIRRKIARDPKTSPCRKIGSSLDKHARLRSWSKRLAREHHAGQLSREGSYLAEHWHCVVTDDWLLGLLWDWIRGPDAQGDTSPGNTEWSLSDWEGRFGKWPVCRRIRNDLLFGGYEFLPYRHVRVRKRSGRGFRSIEIPEAPDLLVEKALNVGARDFLRVGLPQACVAYRPGCGPMRALARALALAEQHSCHRWLSVDIADAFGSVILPRLNDLLHKRIPCEGMVDLIMGAVAPSRRTGTNVERMSRFLGLQTQDCIASSSRTPRGLPQGSPLAPSLFNAYTASCVVMPWQKRCPRVPLLVYGDDLLVPCPTKDAARNAHRHLREILRSAGFTPNPTKTRLVNVNRDSLVWLGHQISRTNDGYIVDIPKRSWSRIETKIRKHAGKGDLRAVRQTVASFIEYHAPALEARGTYPVANRLERILQGCGLSNAMPADNNTWSSSILTTCATALNRWHNVRFSQSQKVQASGS